MPSRFEFLTEQKPPVRASQSGSKGAGLPLSAVRDTNVLDDASLQEIGPKIPSSASKDYGRPFAEVLKAYNHDFYQVDPLLFSPAVVTLVNLDTGNSFRYGKLNREVLAASFGVTTG